MRNKFKRIFLIAICLALCLGAASCREPEQAEPQETTEQTTAEATVQTTVQTTAVTFTGNKDFFWNTRFDHRSYQNGDGITFELLSDPFRVGDSYENLGVRVVDIDSELYICSYGGYLNLEKKIDGEWVRLEVIRGPYFNGSEDEVGRQRRDELLDQYSVFHMLECEIIPELTAGEYRFVAYFMTGAVRTNAQGVLQPGIPEEIRHYLIPFEVVE